MVLLGYAVPRLPDAATVSDRLADASKIPGGLKIKIYLI
jgi:hypothetical protein